MLFESSYPPLLQGVSEQHQDLRKPGQVTELVNMVCDPVTGLRRRPGCAYKWHTSTSTTDWIHLYTEVIDIAGYQAILWVDTHMGKVWLLDQTTHEQIAEFTAPYVLGNKFSIRTAFVGDTLYLCNTLKRPNVKRAQPYRRWQSSGFAYVLSGSYGKTYDLTIRGRNGVGRVARYTTPSGQGTNDAALATPEYIAKQLADLITGNMADLPGVGVEVRGAYIFAWTEDPDTIIEVTSDVGSTFMVASGTGRVATVSQLPAILPPRGDRAVIAVGYGRAPQYYRYDGSQQAWLETGGPNSVSAIADVPVSIYRKNGTWYIDWNDWEGRFAGDDVTNPDFHWLSAGITGMCAYQGRLCILSGNYVAFSAAGNPKRWYRSTVTELLDSDPIEVGASSQSSASYTWGVQYQRDLLLFSKSHQAVVPSTGQAITPRTATVAPTSGYATDTNVPPAIMGKTLMYARPTAPGYTGFMEMIPSQYTAGQYISDDATPHLPRYFSGEVSEFKASASVPMAAVLMSNTRYHLQVYEYTWDGDQRVQSAWHRWTFPYPIESIYWVGGLLHIVFNRSNNVRIVCTLDPRGSSESARNTYPFLDLHFSSFLSNFGLLSKPEWLSLLDKDFEKRWVGVVADQGLPDWGMPVPLDDPSRFDVDRRASQVLIGLPYTSTVVPPRPVVVDEKGDAVHTAPKSAVVLKYTFHLQRAYKIKVLVMRGVPYGNPQEWVYREVYANQWDQFSLVPGSTWAAPEAVTDMPLGVQMDEHFLRISSDSVYELNLLGLSFVVNYKPLFQRR